MRFLLRRNDKIKKLALVVVKPTPLNFKLETLNLKLETKKNVPIHKTHLRHTIILDNAPAPFPLINSNSDWVKTNRRRLYFLQTRTNWI
jgi:hypothetical protein